MKSLKLGLIGAGGIARLHLDAMQKIDGLKAVGLTSRSLPAAKQLATDYQIPVCTESVDEMVAQAKPDALLVLVSVDQMFAVTKKALGFGLPLFVEKPAGISPEENLELAESAKEQGVKTMVGFNRRYYSIFHKGIKLIRERGSLLGVLVEGHERMPQVRGMNRFSDLVLNEWLYANSIHTIDLLRFFGGEPLHIESIAHRLHEPRGDQFGAIMELESGGIGQYIAHWYSPGGWRVVLYGEGLTVEFKPLEQGRFTDEDFKSQEIVPDEEDLQLKPGFIRQMQAFADLVREGKAAWPLQDLEGSYRTMVLAQTISSSVGLSHPGGERRA